MNNKIFSDLLRKRKGIHMTKKVGFTEITKEINVGKAVVSNALFH